MTTRKRKKGAGSSLDIVIFAVAILAVVAIVTGLVVAGLTRPEGPPDLRATITNSAESSGGRMFEITVENAGGATAEQIELEVTLGKDVRTLTIPAIARGDEEVGSVVFPANATGEPTIEVQSFSEPTR